MELQQRPRRRCSLARVLMGVVVFALVAFVATHGWLQSLQDVEREVEHLFHPHHDGAGSLRAHTHGRRRTRCVTKAAAAAYRSPSAPSRCRPTPPTTQPARDAPERGRARLLPTEARATARQRVRQVRGRTQSRRGGRAEAAAAAAEEAAAREAMARDAPPLSKRRRRRATGGGERGEVHLGIRDAGPHALATGYTGSDFIEEDHDPNAPEDLQKALRGDRCIVG